MYVNYSSIPFLLIIISLLILPAHDNSGGCSSGMALLLVVFTSGVDVRKLKQRSEKTLPKLQSAHFGCFHRISSEVERMAFKADSV